MNKCKKLFRLIFIISFINFTSPLIGDELIVPKKKPQLSEEKKTYSKLKSEIIPLKKPVPKKENLTSIKKKEKVVKQTGIILPKNKPLIIAKEKIKKKDKVIKSKYYSRKDFEIAKKAINLVEKRKWDVAIKTSKKARDKSIYDFIVWRYLLEKTNNADYVLYKQFLEKNNNYPRIGRIKYLSEKKLSTKNVSSKKL